MSMCYVSMWCPVLCALPAAASLAVCSSVCVLWCLRAHPLHVLVVAPTQPAAAATASSRAGESRDVTTAVEVAVAISMLQCCVRCTLSTFNTFHHNRWEQFTPPGQSTCQLFLFKVRQ